MAGVFTSLAEWFINMCNLVIKAVGLGLAWVISLFPSSPFQNPSSPPASVNLGYITWIFDFPTWIVHFLAVLTAIGVYYLYRVAARWLKVARG